MGDPSISVKPCCFFPTFSPFFVRPLGGLLASLTLVFPILVDRMLRDACCGLHCIVLRAVPVPDLYVVHPSQILRMTQDVAQSVFLEFFSVFVTLLGFLWKRI